MEENLEGYLVTYIFEIMEGEAREIFRKQSKASNHAIKFSFLSNILLWDRMYIDGDFLTWLDFIDWLRSS